MSCPGRCLTWRVQVGTRQAAIQAFLCCDLAALGPAAAAARLYVSSVLPLKINNRRRQGESAALLGLPDESPTAIFRRGQSSRLLTIAAAVTSGKPRISGLTAAPSSALSHSPICVPLCPFNPFSFLILIVRFAIL
jgi:hypothetical protein